MAESRPLAAALRTMGWEFEGGVPPEKKFVCLAVPHTSNWDGLLLLALTQSIGQPIAWMIKREWVRGPLGVVLRRTGAIGIDRSGANNLVEQMVRRMKTEDRLALVIPPEGTRKRTEYWKSGFYHIALGAQVPVVPGYLDYRRKRAGLGPAIHLTGHVRKDMDAIRAFYTKLDARGRDHAKFGPIRLRDEDKAL